MTNTSSPDLKYAGKSRTLEYVWLCSLCCRDMTIEGLRWCCNQSGSETRNPKWLRGGHLCRKRD